jgi:hypothetical protein
MKQVAGASNSRAICCVCPASRPAASVTTAATLPAKERSANEFNSAAGYSDIRLACHQIRSCQGAANSSARASRSSVGSSPSLVPICTPTGSPV